MVNKKREKPSIGERTETIACWIVFFIIFDIFAYLAFLVFGGTDVFSNNLNDNSPYFTTVGYAETVDDPIEIYGRNTKKELNVDKCTTGICFEIPPQIDGLNAQSNTIITGSNECTDSWAVNVATDITLGGTHASIIDHINGKKNPEFLRAVQNRAKILKSRNFEVSIELPVYSTDGRYLYDYFYKKETAAFNKYIGQLKKNTDSEALNSALKDAIDKPYKKSIDSLTDSLNENAKSAMPTIYSVSTTINGFNKQGDVDYGHLLENPLIQANFNCNTTL